MTNSVCCIVRRERRPTPSSQRARATDLGGYAGMGKRPEHAGRDVGWRCAPVSDAGCRSGGEGRAAQGECGASVPDLQAGVRLGQGALSGAGEEREEHETENYGLTAQDGSDH